MRTRVPWWFLFGLAALAVGCGRADPPVESASHATEVDESRGDVEVEAGGGDGPQAEFWARLEALCGQAFEGELVEGTEEGDRALDGVRLVMDAHTCEGDEIRIGFYAGEDRSRTWVFRRKEGGLYLQHDHRHADGTAEEVTDYGGPTQSAGTGSAQDFHADEHTAEVAPEAATNIWTVAIEPGERFVYALRRQVGDRRFRAEFDLSRPVDATAAPQPSQDAEIIEVD